jgi:hypothetical protein
VPAVEAAGAELSAGAAEAPTGGESPIPVLTASSPRPPTASTPAVLNASILVPRERDRRLPRLGPADIRAGMSPAERSP